MALVVPALLSRAGSEGSEVYKETSSRLLELAATDQSSFRSLVAGMDFDKKKLLEEILREGSQGNKSAARTEDGSGQPSIALKMDFGKV
jgi:hypothetical protein